MKIVNTSLNQAETINRLLEAFIEDFNHLNLTQRLDANNEVFKALNEFFQTQHSIMSYAFTKNPSYRSQLGDFEKAHADVERIYKMLIMSHVEEIRYKEDLQKLHDAFTAYVQQPYEDFMCHIQASFTEADEEAITVLLKQPVHA
ncbi:MAG: hypothetical protein QE263_05190 [Vampirovibrionales bacterium]|nr:hypothetical protein [Vampirovibrionales bacterium]